MKLNPTQTATLLALHRALERATDSGVLDAMTVSMHPDLINGFCDGVKQFIARELDMIQVEGFNVRVVEKGQPYGRNDCLIHDQDEPLVEFYDAKQNVALFGPRGQFVSRYYRSTLMEGEYPQGLALDGGVPQWSMSPAGMRAVKAFVQQHMNRTL